jgi:hypothetical protein
VNGTAAWQTLLLLTISTGPDPDSASAHKLVSVPLSQDVSPADLSDAYVIDSGTEVRVPSSGDSSRTCCMCLYRAIDCIGVAEHVGENSRDVQDIVSRIQDSEG